MRQSAGGLAGADGAGSYRTGPAGSSEGPSEQSPGRAPRSWTRRSLRCCAATAREYEIAAGDVLFADGD